MCITAGPGGVGWFSKDEMKIGTMRRGIGFLASNGAVASTAMDDVLLLLLLLLVDGGRVIRPLLHGTTGECKHESGWYGVWPI